MAHNRISDRENQVLDVTQRRTELLLNGHDYGMAFTIYLDKDEAKSLRDELNTFLAPDESMARFEKAEGDFHQLAVAGGVNDVPNYDSYNPELDQADGFRA